MLTDSQLEQLSEKMDFKTAGCFFKDSLPKKIQYNTGYFINLDDQYDANGHLNSGSHWTCFQLHKYPNGKIEGLYFDPFGIPPPEQVKKFVGETTGKGLPYNKKDIQSLMNNACGWYCAAYLHWINANPLRTGDLYQDTETFLSLFDDLNESTDFKKNEWVLKHFFQSKDPKRQREIDVISNPDNIISEEGNGIDITKI